MSAVTSDKFGRLIYSEQALCDLVMRGVDTDFAGFVVQDLDLEPAREWLITVPALMQYHALNISVTEFDQHQQSRWHMPESYQQLDIAQYVLNLCCTGHSGCGGHTALATCAAVHCTGQAHRAVGHISNAVY